jgi:hypothetical protein
MGVANVQILIVAVALFEAVAAALVPLTEMKVCDEVPKDMADSHSFPLNDAMSTNQLL